MSTLFPNYTMASVSRNVSVKSTSPEIIKKIEQEIIKEAKNEEKSLKNAVKDLHHAEKDTNKAHKVKAHFFVK